MSDFPPVDGQRAALDAAGDLELIGIAVDGGAGLVDSNAHKIAVRAATGPAKIRGTVGKPAQESIPAIVADIGGPVLAIENTGQVTLPGVFNVPGNAAVVDLHAIAVGASGPDCSGIQIINGIARLRPDGPRGDVAAVDDGFPRG